MKRARGVDKGIELARTEAPEHADLIETFKGQLLIVFLKRLQGLGVPLVFPLAEVDDTGHDMLAFSIRDGAFHFDLRKKG